MNDIQTKLSQINARKLYHLDVYMPTYLYTYARRLIMLEDTFIFSNHVKQSTTRKKHEFTLKDLNKICHKLNKQCSPFEIETQFGEITKICVRTQYKDKDISIALAPVKDGLMVKTAWINEKDDDHKTLNVEMYERVE